MKKLLSLFAFLLCSAGIYAQVTIAPTNLFLDSGNRFGTYMVINGSAQSQEISIDFYYGYFKSDETGNTKMIDDDSTTAERYSIAGYVRAFPQNFVLAPGQRQVVRLRVNAPNDLPDGTYWARIRTASTPETPPVEVTSTEAVTAQVGITVEQVTGLFYKKGNVTTGIEVEEIRTELMENGQLAVLTDVKRTGNSPFLGSITASLLNSNNETVKEAFVSTSIYFDGTHRQTLNISDVPAGKYKIRVRFESRRSDIASSDLIQMEPVTETISYTIR